MREKGIDKLIINFTPTGMIPTKDLTPHVAVTPEEIIKDILESRQYGVSMAHIHARDEEGKPTYKKEIYKEIIQGIRAEDKDMILCVSTSGRNWPEFEKRSECLDITGGNKPDMGSLTLSSLNFNKQASINSPQMIQMLAKKMLDLGIKPELEVFDLGMINYAKYLHSKKLIEPPFYFNLILGNIACAQASILNLGLLINELPDNSIWAVGGVGDVQLKMNINGMINGGGVRVGIEDNIWFTSKRKQLATNADLLKRIQTIADALHIEIATPQEVREALNLQKK
ncbi:3-keto-5-aminohexanoate cleavage protein [Candidatus Omnitrophota bacterium]